MYTYIKRIYSKIPFIKFNKTEAEEVIVETEEQDVNSKTDWLATESLSKLAVDMYEQDGEYIIKAIVADINPEDIKVIIDDNKLTLKVKRKKEKIDEIGNYFYQECYWGDYERIIDLPGEVKNQGIEAILKNGVLKIKIKKLIKTGPTTINVKADE